MRALTHGSQEPDSCAHGSIMDASKGATDAGAADSAPPASAVNPSVQGFMPDGRALRWPLRERMRVVTRGSQKPDSHEVSHKKPDEVCLNPACSKACQLQ